MKKINKIFLLLLIALTIVSGCSPKVTENTPAQTSAPIETTGAVQPVKENWTAELYFSNMDATQIIAEKRDLASDSKLDTAAKAKLAIEELLKGAKNSDLTTSIPKTAKLRSVTIENKTAVVDMSKEFVTDNVGSSAGETMAIAPIVLTLTAIEGITEVAFKIEGKVQSEFKGHYALDGTFKRAEFEQYIKK